jgi:predicted P-loop ATPase
VGIVQFVQRLVAEVSCHRLRPRQRRARQLRRQRAASRRRSVEPAWLTLDEAFKFRPPIEFFQIVVSDLARRRSVHPVKDYLNSLAWDESPRIDRWLIEYAGAADTPYVRAVGVLFLIAAVRRVRFPGCKFDELPILESKQGTRKSQALRALCPNEDWFSDDLPLGVDAKQIIERTAGKWLIEASELQGYTNSEIERLKGMLSRQVDGPVRLAYANSYERPNAAALTAIRRSIFLMILARPAGLEPATSWFVARRSIQLS